MPYRYVKDPVNAVKSNTRPEVQKVFGPGDRLMVLAPRDEFRTFRVFKGCIRRAISLTECIA